VPHNNERESSSHLERNLLHANMGLPSHFYKHACEFASHFFRCFTVSFTAVVEMLHSCPGVGFTVRFKAIVEKLHSWLNIGFTVRFTAIVEKLHSWLNIGFTVRFTAIVGMLHSFLGVGFTNIRLH